MRQPTTDQILNLTSTLILPFHEIKRQHKLPIGRRRRESDVEHSWTVSLLACSLAPQIDPSLDTGKIAQFDLVHDLVEVFAGDTSHFRASESWKSSKKDREYTALKRIENEFRMFPWLAETITEYEAADCNEAIFVYAVDKYIAVIYDLLDRGLYLHELGVDKAKYDELMKIHRPKAHKHARVGQYYDEIRKLIDQQPGFLA